MSVKTHIKKDDKVKIIAGKDKGKIGKILRVIRKDNQVIVENINKVKRHQKPDMKNRQGGIIEKEAPIHLSNVMLMCSHCMKPSRVMIRVLEKEGETSRVRVCKKCNEHIDV
ncbi:50S ribosomal protein L24 [Desulfococcaceae bacterium OttesenSCG-928-F15]|nr:50S ribosomal protein L24 [Desulfococcaceae bacterium OttesenSCG-928-F15]